MTAPPPDLREIAVEIVDAIHGYTYEFSHQQEQHISEYDLAEEVLKRICANDPRDAEIAALREESAILSGILDDALEGMRAFQMMALAIQKYECLPIPAIIDAAVHNTPIMIGRIEQAKARAAIEKDRR